MATARRTRTAGRRLRIGGGVFFLLLGTLLFAAQEKPAGENRAAPAKQGIVVTVPLPLVGEVDEQVRATIDRLLDDAPPKAAGERPLLVLEFRQDSNSEAGQSGFERGLALARYLAGPRLAAVETVAWLPGNVTGHAVLPVLACEQIVMHPDAELGAAGEGEAQIDDTLREGYREIAERRRTLPPALVLGMLDPALAVSRVETLDGVSYVLPEELAALEQQAAVNSVTTLVQPGVLGKFSGRQLRVELSLVGHLAENRRQLAGVLGVDTLAEETVVEAWKPLRVELYGPLTGRPVQIALRGLEQAIEKGEVNFLLVTIESPGGRLEESLRLAQRLAELDRRNVRSVAFIGGDARADAALVALACDHLVMTPNALLGGPGAREFSRGELKDLRRVLPTLMAAKDRDWSLAAGLLDSELEVHHYEDAQQALTRYYSAEELSAQPEPGRWNRGEAVELAEGLTGQEARELGLATRVVSGLGEVREIYGLPESMPQVEPNWAETFIAAIATRRAGAFFMFIGFFCLIAEGMHPGIGVFGFVSALCFLLYFWGAFLNGNSGYLEVLLFLAGLTCIGLELFVLPGFGVFGLGGGALVIASIVLSSQTFVFPRNDYQLEQVLGSLLMVGVAVAGVLTAGFAMRRLLPHAPVVRGMMLPPAGGRDTAELRRRESLVDFTHLHGKRGVAETRLSPAGKVRFGDELIDVVSSGDLLPKGTPVRVVEIHGNHVVVEAIEETA